MHFNQPLITAFIAGVPGLCLSVFACKKLYKKDYLRFFKMVIAILFVVFFTYGNIISPLLNKDESYKPVFNYFEELSTNGAGVSLYRPIERVRGAAVFYLKRSVPVIKGEENLTTFLSSNDKAVALVVFGKNNVQEIPSTKILKSFDVGRRKLIFLTHQKIKP